MPKYLAFRPTLKQSLFSIASTKKNTSFENKMQSLKELKSATSKESKVFSFF